MDPFVVGEDNTVKSATLKWFADTCWADEDFVANRDADIDGIMNIAWSNRHNVAKTWRDVSNVSPSVFDGISAIFSECISALIIDLEEFTVVNDTLAQASDRIREMIDTGNRDTALFFVERSRKSANAVIAAKYVGIIPDDIKQVLVLDNAYTNDKRDIVSRFVIDNDIKVLGIAGTVPKDYEGNTKQNGIAPDYCILQENRDYVFYSNDNLFIPLSAVLDPDDVDMSYHVIESSAKQIANGFASYFRLLCNAYEDIVDNASFAELASFLSFGMLDDKDEGIKFIDDIVGDRPFMNRSPYPMFHGFRGRNNSVDAESLSNMAGRFNPFMNKSVYYENNGLGATVKISIPLKKCSHIDYDNLRNDKVLAMFHAADQLASIAAIWHDLITACGIMFEKNEKMNKQKIHDIADYLGVKAATRGILAGVPLQDVDDEGDGEVANVLFSMIKHANMFGDFTIYTLLYDIDYAIAETFADDDDSDGGNDLAMEKIKRLLATYNSTQTECHNFKDDFESSVQCMLNKIAPLLK